MVDLTECKELNNSFGGSEVKKRIIYKDKIYMVKFPDRVRQLHNSLSYMNNQFSEDIGCKIFKSVGIDTQNTFLATYTMPNDEVKIVVACEDFTQYGHKLFEFYKLSLMSEESSSIRTRANVDSIMSIIDQNSSIVNKESFKLSFWEMFVVDGLINNSDRNLENFGILEDRVGRVSFAPIFDCGSSLSGLLTNEAMEYYLHNFSKFKQREFNVFSAFRRDGKKILFSEEIKNPTELLSQAIINIVPKIDLNQIDKIIYSTEGMSSVHKEYMSQSIELRYATILQPAYKKEYKKLLDKTRDEEKYNR